MTEARIGNQSGLARPLKQHSMAWYALDSHMGSDSQRLDLV